MKNMGQRYVQLASTYTGSTGDNTGVLHVQQLPPNPAIIVPGPALFFVVVNGVPSVGLQIMIGSGQLGAQPTQEAASLPQSAFVQSLNPGSDSNTNNKQHSSALAFCRIDSTLALMVTLIVVMFMF
jgi:hypothetical protein